MWRKPQELACSHFMFCSFIIICMNNDMEGGNLRCQVSGCLCVCYVVFGLRALRKVKNPLGRQLCFLRIK